MSGSPSAALPASEGFRDATPESGEAARWLAPGCAAAAVCLGAALQLSNGFLHTTGLALVSVALVLTLAAVVITRAHGWARRDRGIVRVVAAAGLMVHAGYLLSSVPGFYVQAGAGGLRPFQAGALMLTLLGALAVAWPARRAAPVTAALIITHAVLGVWIIQHSPDPAIDVHIFQKYSAAALLRGENPYGLTFPDIYNNGAFYGDGLSVDGRLQFGFPYFPLSLLAAMPGHVFGHDPRFSQLAAMELTALLMALARPGGLGVMAAALYLTTPRGFFVLEQSWTEPFVVFGVALVVFAACRRSWLTPWLFGGFVAIKQYLVFALPAAVLLTTGHPRARDVAAILGKGAAVGAALTLPFVLWDPAAFLKSVVTLQFYQPFRGDALSYLAWWVGMGHEPPSTAIPFALAAAASGLAVWRLPRTPAGFSAALALTFFVFFALNKQAFANYYFFVLGTLCTTLAAWRPPEAEA